MMVLLLLLLLLLLLQELLCVSEQSAYRASQPASEQA